MQQLWFLERVLDICGHSLGIPTREMRLRNYIRKMRCRTNSERLCVRFGGLAGMLAMGKKLIGGTIGKRNRRTAQGGRWIGGIALTLDSGTNILPGAHHQCGSAVFRTVQGGDRQVDIYGAVVISMGSSAKGQGHETTARRWWPMCWACLSGHVQSIKRGFCFDTEQNAYTGHTGTYASQFAVTGSIAMSRRRRPELANEMSRLRLGT